MSPQEIFDTVAQHLFQQGKRSVDSRHCKYHNEDGLKCSVGALITEELYFPEIDSGNRTIKYLVEHYQDKFPDWIVNNVDLLSALQSVHDMNNNWQSADNMEEALLNVAEYFDLSPSKLEGLKKDFNQEVRVEK